MCDRPWWHLKMSGQRVLFNTVLKFNKTNQAGSWISSVLSPNSNSGHIHLPWTLYILASLRLLTQPPTSSKCCCSVLIRSNKRGAGLLPSCPPCTGSLLVRELNIKYWSVKCSCYYYRTFVHMSHCQRPEIFWPEIRDSILWWQGFLYSSLPPAIRFSSYIEILKSLLKTQFYLSAFNCASLNQIRYFFWSLCPCLLSLYIFLFSFSSSVLSLLFYFPL